MLRSEVILWLIFTVFISLIPLGADYLYLSLIVQQQEREKPRPRFESFFKDGQILLIAVALGAGAIADILIVSLKKPLENAEISFLGVSFLTTIISAFLYANIKRTNPENLSEELVFQILTILFFIALIEGFVCKSLSL